MRIQDLVASDFPGVDPEKFDEWKAMQIRANRLPMIGLAIMVGSAFITIPLIGGGIGYMLPLIAYFAFMLPQASSGRRLRKLAMELRMRERLKAKREGKSPQV